MDRFVNISAYKFVTLGDLTRRRDEWLSLCQKLSLKGTILLSEEGINLFLAGSRFAIDEILKHICSDPSLADLRAKESFSDHQPFSRMLIKIKKEIIAFDVDGIDPRRETSRRVSAVQLKQWLDDGEPVVMLDTRNDFEVEVGTFDNAVPIRVDDFRSFSDAVDLLPEEMKCQKIVTFCTGGIRCEKAAPLMERKGFEDVYQLDGGILKYFELCGGDHYHGECFVFDQRVALDSDLQETETTQCFACLSPLTLEDRQSEKFEVEISCPHCYVSLERQQALMISKRHEAIQGVSQPLPGSNAYDNIKPIRVTGPYDGLKLIDFLTSIHTRLSRDDWMEEIEAGRLQLENQSMFINTLVRAGQRLQHMMPGTTEPDVNADIQIMYEDEALVVVNKPAPLPMHPCGRFNRNTLSWILREAYKPVALRPAHRLDANTSGVVVFAKSRKFAARLQPQFERGDVIKTYIARVQGQPETDQFISTTPLDAEPCEVGARLPHPEGVNAHTEFQVLQRFSDDTALLEVRPITGRTNQIRAHLWDMGLPIVGDPFYLADKQTGNSLTLLPCDPPLCLHARRIDFEHPASHERVSFEAPIPSWAKE